MSYYFTLCLTCLDLFSAKPVFKKKFIFSFFYIFICLMTCLCVWLVRMRVLVCVLSVYSLLRSTLCNVQGWRHSCLRWRFKRFRPRSHFVSQTWHQKFPFCLFFSFFFLMYIVLYLVAASHFVTYGFSHRTLFQVQSRVTQRSFVLSWTLGHGWALHTPNMTDYTVSGDDC